MTAMVGTLTSIPGKSEAVDFARQQVFGEDQPARFSAHRAGADTGEMKGAVPEIPVERRKLRRLQLESRSSLPPFAVVGAAPILSGTRPQRPKGYTQPRSWQALATRPMAIA